MDARTRNALTDAHDQLRNGWTPTEIARGLAAHLADLRTMPRTEATPVEAWAGGPR